MGVDRTYHGNSHLDHLAKGGLADFSPAKLPFYLFHTLCFGSESPSPAHAHGEGNLSSTCRRRAPNICSLGFFGKGDWSHLFIYLFIQLLFLAAGTQGLLISFFRL